MKILFFLIFLLGSSTSLALTKSDLLSKSDIPEKRNFPLSTKILPCQDFHAYVCNEVETSFQLPDDRTHWVFSFTDAAERMLFAKKTFFKKINQNNKVSSPRSQQLKDFYSACMNPKAQIKDEKFWVEKQKKEILKVKNREELIRFTNTRMATALFSMLDFGMTANQADPTVNDLLLISDLMSLPENSYYENKDLLFDYQKVIEKLFKEAGLDKAEKRALDVINFEIEFAKIYPKPAELRKRYTSDNYWSREKLQKTYPHISFEAFFSKLNKKTGLRNLSPESIKFTEKSLTDRPVEQLKNVMLFNSLRSLMDDAYPAYYEEFFNFKKKYLGGAKVRPPRDERCTLSTTQTFSMELDHELIPILFPNFPDKDVITLAEKVRLEILKGIQKNTWLSTKAREEALQKISLAQMKLIKPQTPQDWNFLPIKKYSSQKPITNKFTARMASLEKQWFEVKAPRFRNRWEMGPLGLNAYYSAEDNQFVLLQGILQYPFYDPRMSPIENIAAIGTIVGHELGHGIDDQGSKYDHSGKLRQWMTSEDLAEFTKRGQVFVERFNKIGHDGPFTLGENIGDHVGMTFSLDAAFSNLKVAAIDDLKMFFVAYARMWCHVERPDFRKMLLKVDPHASGTARINEQVIHQDAFYQAFQCQTTDAMYLDPKNRIRIW